jgi:hypothetical protein
MTRRGLLLFEDGRAASLHQVRDSFGQWCVRDEPDPFEDERDPPEEPDEELDDELAGVFAACDVAACASAALPPSSAPDNVTASTALPSRCRIGITSSR